MEKNYLDGGVFAQDPIIEGFAELKSYYPHLNEDDLIIVSLGTGVTKMNFKYSDDHGYGLWQTLTDDNNIFTFFFKYTWTCHS